MSYWSPLFYKIINSTVWSETKDVKILWVTMMAMKDKDGFVESSLVGLSRSAGLTFEETKVAILVLESPDTKSTTYQEFEGRRVKQVEGGWMVLNHFKYRDEMSKMRQRVQQAEWQKKYREKKKKGKVYVRGEDRLKEKAFENGEVDRDGVPITPKTNGDFEE